jgi:gas vesicle protein
MWLGAGLKVDGTISWTKASQRAVVGFVVTALVAPIHQWRSDRTKDPKTSAKEWLANTAWQAIKKGAKSTTLTALLSSAGKYWRNAIERAVEDIARAKAQAIGKDEAMDQMLELGAERLAMIVSKAENKARSA